LHASNLATPPTGVLGRWGALFRGLTWKTVVIVFLFNMLIAGLQYWECSDCGDARYDFFIFWSIVGFALMLALHAGANWQTQRLPRWLVLAISVAAGTLLGTFIWWIVKGRDFTLIFTHNDLRHRLVNYLASGVFMGTIGAIVFSARLRVAFAESERHRADAERQAMTRQMMEARLKLLQAQVEPHFLYNTLANVQALIEVDPPKASQMIEHLIQYLRAALPQMREDGSTLGRELDLARAYLDIMQIRMGERLHFEIDVSKSLRALPFPPMMLASLVENAVQHGLCHSAKGGRADIRAEQSAGRLSVSVVDNGSGFRPDAKEGVGLSNIRERLLALYGGRARLLIEDNSDDIAPHGVKATIEVPLHNG
jgi:two-component sensor histidine kinase